MAQHRNIDEEKKIKDSWTDLYFFVEQKGKPISLICNESVSLNKGYNLKWQSEMVK